MKTIALVIADKNFRDEEYQHPKDVLVAAGFKVITACTTTKTVVGKLGLEVKPDMLVMDLIIDQIDALIFIGGGGAEQYFNDIIAHQLLKSAQEKGKIYGAICIAPVILANAGLLQDKKATVFSSEIETIKKAGAIYSTDDVVVDGKLVTANGPAAAKRFGEAIVKLTCL
jgi:protease I